MGIKSGLKKLSELAVLTLYIEIPPIMWPLEPERILGREEIAKYEQTHSDKFLFNRLVKPLVLGYYRQAEKREALIDKYREVLTNNHYFNKFIEPLVLRLHDHAIQSKRIKRYPCSYKGTTFAYTVKNHAIFPILTMGSEEELYNICKKECYVCPTVVYSPALFIALFQLAMFEVARLGSKIKNEIIIKN